MKRLTPLILFLTGEVFQIWINMILGTYFLVMIPIALITDLQHSVPFLVTISLWALVAAHWSGALAALAARRVVASNEATNQTTEEK